MASNVSFDVSIPEYNEISRSGENGFYEQLDYLTELSDSSVLYGSKVKLVDDFSVDGSWDALSNYFKDNKPHFEISRTPHNTQKVGAIRKGVKEMSARYAVLTDFDSQIENPESIYSVIERMEQDEKIAGAALKVIPKENSLLGRLQDLDYAMGRVIGARYLKKSKKLRCIAGAGGIWKRDPLLGFLNEHSGRHNGDDMETTAIAMKRGYDVIYAPEVLIKTKTPQSYKSLLKQRIRWEKGALETFSKERNFYFNQVKNIKNRFAHTTLWEWYNWASLPIAIGTTAHSLITGNNTALSYYLGDMAFTSFISYFARNEVKDKKEFALLPVMPIFRAAVSFPTKVAALGSFVKNNLFDHKVHYSKNSTESITPSESLSIPSTTFANILES